MKNNTTNLVPTGHEVGTVTTVSGEILASFFLSFYTSKNNFKKFLKRLDVKNYNYDSSDKYLDFICGKTHFSKDTYDTDMVWIMYLNEKNQVTPDTIVSFDANDDWEIW